MRRRLGISTALLGEPEVLNLDEPANGLDPAGIRWMHDLLRDNANRGATVLLSSHLLHEIEVVADDLLVIGNGRIVAQGTKAELLATAGTLVQTPCVEALAEALGTAGVRFAPSSATADRDALRVEADPDLVGRIAVTAGVALVELRPDPRRSGSMTIATTSPGPASTDGPVPTGTAPRCTTRPAGRPIPLRGEVTAGCAEARCEALAAG